MLFRVTSECSIEIMHTRVIFSSFYAFVSRLLCTQFSWLMTSFVWTLEQWNRFEVAWQSTSQLLSISYNFPSLPNVERSRSRRKFIWHYLVTQRKNLHVLSDNLCDLFNLSILLIEGANFTARKCIKFSSPLDAFVSFLTFMDRDLISSVIKAHNGRVSVERLYQNIS